jgi:hypothetical protein
MFVLVEQPLLSTVREHNEIVDSPSLPKNRTIKLFDFYCTPKRMIKFLNRYIFTWEKQVDSLTLTERSNC